MPTPSSRRPAPCKPHPHQRPGQRRAAGNERRRTAQVRADLPRQCRQQRPDPAEGSDCGAIVVGSVFAMAPLSTGGTPDLLAHPADGALLVMRPIAAIIRCSSAGRSTNPLTAGLASFTLGSRGGLRRVDGGAAMRHNTGRRRWDQVPAVALACHNGRLDNNFRRYLM